MSLLLLRFLIGGWVFARTLAADISLGAYHSCAVSSQQGLMCWGLNNYGQLGLGTRSATNKASVVLSISNVVDVATRTIHTCAISVTVLYCWGRNRAGQLGTGNQVDSYTPAQILSGVDAVGVGTAHTCAITSGNVSCWGNNIVGQLGDGSTNSSDVPVQVSLSNGYAVSIAVGGQHSCAVLSDASVVCWGRNNYGQLGIGSISDYSAIPVVVPAITGSATIVAGTYHTCALYDVGTVACWGNNKQWSLGSREYSTADRPRSHSVSFLR